MHFKMRVDLVRKDKRYTAKHRGAMKQNRIDNTLWFCGPEIPSKKFRFDAIATLLTWGYEDSLPTLMTEEQWNNLKERIEYECKRRSYMSSYSLMFDKVRATPADEYNPTMKEA